ncbi:MAG TPA: hypothetical protein VHY08_08095 [Bacillota bacterium]|nr:hypothetical protein [Bacillota bacterium]
MDQEPNWFVRILIIIFSLLLVGMVGVSFLCGKPPYIITSGTITIILIVTILILSEAFNNLSLGKVLSLSKRVTEKESQNVALRDENKELRQHIIQITSNINNQSQLTANINGVPTEILRQLFTVTPMGIEEKESEKQIEDTVKEDSRQSERQIHNLLYKAFEIAEKGIIKTYLQQQQLSIDIVQYDVKFTPLFQGLDPIMERHVGFDAYYKLGNSEVFIEVIRKQTLSPMRLDRLYVMLSKILHYRQAKNVDAKLVAIVVDFPGMNSVYLSVDRFVQFFQPAISNSLLRIEHIELTHEEFEAYKKEAAASIKNSKED